MWLAMPLNLVPSFLAGLTVILALPIVVIAFTAVTMVGVTNATNNIGGFDGLATGAFIFMLAAFAAVALKENDRPMASFCIFQVTR